MPREFPERLYLVPDPEHHWRWIEAYVGDEHVEYVRADTARQEWAGKPTGDPKRDRLSEVC